MSQTQNIIAALNKSTDSSEAEHNLIKQLVNYNNFIAVLGNGAELEFVQKYNKDNLKQEPNEDQEGAEELNGAKPNRQ